MTQWLNYILLVLPEPIKGLGYTNVPVKLFPGVEAKIRVHVTEK